MVKHTSIREWRHLHKNTIINPEQLSNAAKDTCYVPRWAEGAIDALHEACEDYLITLLEDANLLVNPRKTCNSSAKGHPAGL